VRSPQRAPEPERERRGLRSGKLPLLMPILPAWMTTKKLPCQAEQKIIIHPRTSASVASWFFPHEPEDDVMRAALREEIEALFAEERARDAGLECYRNAWEALRMIREAVETLGPPGALRSEEAVWRDWGRRLSTRPRRPSRAFSAFAVRRRSARGAG
jgi:hypothetical protein